jgi:tetratricopeptide (TPR) repeat protein
MKKVKQGIRSVYEVPEEETPQAGPAGLPQELLEAALRRYRIQTVCFCSLTIALMFALAGVLFRKPRAAAADAPSASAARRTYVPYYTLPKESLWVISYEREAKDLDLIAATNQPLSIEWVKHTAYHLITAQQSLKAEQFDQAIDHFEKALTIFPELHGINSLLGTLYLRQGILDEAVNHLRSAQQEQPDYATLNNLGSALMAAGRMDEAERVLLEAQAQNPDHPATYKNLALLYRETGQPDPALAGFEEYFARNDQDIAAMKLYAEYLISLDKREQAVRFLNEYSQSHAESGLPLYLLLASVEAKQQNEEAALAALKKMIQYVRPTRALTELHSQEFDPIRECDGFRELVRQTELAMVRLEEPR